MDVPNTLAYYEMATITAVKSFIVQAPELQFDSRAKIQDKPRKSSDKLTSLDPHRTGLACPV